MSSNEEQQSCVDLNTHQEEQPCESSTAARLVALALRNYRFGRSTIDDPFAVTVNGPNLAIPLSTKLFRAELSKNYRQNYGKLPNGASLTEAMNVLTAEAMNAAPEEVHLRVARWKDAIVIDLATAQGEAVVVDGDGWDVVERSPVLFRRTPLIGQFPRPTRGGNLSELRQQVNVSDDDWSLIVGFILASYIPDIPHPILLLNGQQGSGKTRAAKLIANFTDPSPASIRSQPKDLEQWQVSADGSWCTVIDNVTTIPAWLADALCRVVTGDGSARRRLYTNSGIAPSTFRRVIIMTSIHVGAIRGDLGERLLFIDMPRISGTGRRTEQQLDAQFTDLRARAFGALLEALAAMLAKLPCVDLQILPRMADFASVLQACDDAKITKNAFSTFVRQQSRLAEDVIQGDPFGNSLFDFIREAGEWKGDATELLSELRPGYSGRQRDWPSAYEFRGRLNQLAPALNELGVTVEFSQDSTTRKWSLFIRYSPGMDENVEPSSNNRVSDSSPAGLSRNRVARRSTSTNRDKHQIPLDGPAGGVTAGTTSRKSRCPALKQLRLNFANCKVSIDFNNSVDSATGHSDQYGV